MTNASKTPSVATQGTRRWKLSTRLCALSRMALLGAVAFGLTALAPAVAAPSIYPTGVTRYEPARAYNSYVLFGDVTAKGHPISYLIDMDGHVVHTWPYAASPTKMIDPARIGGKKGVIGADVSHLSRKGVGLIPGMPLVYENKEIGLVDWDGKVIWRGGSDGPGGGLHQHHDWARLPNGKMLVLGTWVHKIPAFGNRVMYDPVIYEVNRRGKIDWRWIASKHMNELGFTKRQLQMIYHTSVFDFFHMNDMEPLGPNHWAAAGDKRFAPENIMISSRNANFTAIIDRKSGHIVWEIGPNYAHSNGLFSYNKVPGPITQISGQHDSHMIPEGLPGAGDVLVFDNQGEAGYPPAALKPTSGSRVLEINPVTKKVVWEYSGHNSNMPSWDFFSPLFGSAQRLPNGNTLIDEGTDGRIFQVTPDGAIVWEYVSPYITGAHYTKKRQLILGNLVYRAEAVPYNWVPAGTAHSQKSIKALIPANFHVSGAGK